MSPVAGTPRHGRNRVRAILLICLLGFLGVTAVLKLRDATRPAPVALAVTPPPEPVPAVDAAGVALQAGRNGHFYVNGIKVTSPSYQLRPGDVITIRPKEKIYNLYKAVVGDGGSQQTPDWITFDSETLRATMVGLPGPGDFSLPVDVNIVVEFLAR